MAPERVSTFTRIAVAVVMSIGSAAVAYVKARAGSKSESEAGYTALKVAVEGQGRVIEQLQREEGEWHALVAKLLAEEATASRRPTPIAPDTLRQLHRSPAVFAQQPLPDLDTLLRSSAK